MGTTVESLTAFSDFVTAAPLGVVATVDPDGRPEAALVALAVTADGDLVFDTPTAARKTVNIATTPRVAVVIGCTGAVSLQVEGGAVVVSGEDRLAAARVYEARFPGSRALADGFSMVAVRPNWIRHYDAAVTPADVSEGRPQWSR